MRQQVVRGRRTAACRRARTWPAGRPRSAHAAARQPALGPSRAGGDRGLRRRTRRRRLERRARRSAAATISAEHQDRALQEQRRPVDGERAAGGRRPAVAGVSDHQRPAPRPAPTSASTSWTRAGGPPRHERLDQHADAGRAEQDQHRRQRRVLDRRASDGRPSATAARSLSGLTCRRLGDGRRRVGRCRRRSWSASTAGLITSSTGFGKNPSDDDQRDQRGDDERLAQAQVRASPATARRRAGARHGALEHPAGCRARPG